MTLRILAFAAAYRRVAYVLLIDRELKDWRISEKAAGSPVEAAAFAQKWINELKPNVVVTERPGAARKKSEGTRVLIAAIAQTAEHNYLLDIEVPRAHRFRSKYEEAVALVERYPEIAGWLPKKRRFFDNEPRSTVLFEALALADEVQSGPTFTAAAALG